MRSFLETRVLSASIFAAALSVSACGSSESDEDSGGKSAGASTGDPEESGEVVEVSNPLTDPTEGPAAGNAEGGCEIPAEAGLEDVSTPTTVVGDGTAESCTGAAVVTAVASGGVITFDCGDAPVTIELDEPAKVVNDANDEVVIDGGGLVTLSGAGKTRILYMNTCDENQVWTTAQCQNQDHPRLTVQNITFVDGNSKSEEEFDGGGAIWVRGGRFKAVNARFFNNVCADEGPDVGGASIRVTSQFEGKPVYIVNSTFGGAPGLGNSCSNGGGLSSIGVSWTVINSVFSYNRATGRGANPAEAGTPGGGSGAAIYNDGNEMSLKICGSLMEENTVNAHGSAIFFVSNNHTGDIAIEDSSIVNNCGGSWYKEPGISSHDDTVIAITNSTLSECE